MEINITYTTLFVYFLGVLSGIALTIAFFLLYIVFPFIVQKFKVSRFFRKYLKFVKDEDKV
jgi:hypothetical protein